MQQKANELTKIYEGLQDAVKKSMDKLEELIEKNAMTADQVDALINYGVQAADEEYPELTKIEPMTSEEYAAFYKKMAKEFAENPVKYENHAKDSGMSAEELSLLFGQISDSIDQYPEIWQSQERAQLLGPKNLAILVNVFRKQ